MILSDREIRLALLRGQVIITPVPDDAAFASTAVDLRLDAELLLWNVPAADPALGVDPCFRPATTEFNVRDVIRKNTTPHNLRDKPYRFERNTFILGWTQEKLRLPHQSRLCARVEGKSSLARLGLGVHVTAPTIHAGFGVSGAADGDALQLEIWNVGPLPIELVHGMPICQLIFEEVHGTPEKGYRGFATGQGPAPPHG